MKNLFKLLGLLLFCFALFIACDSDSDPDFNSGLNGELTFYADESAGQSGGIITILISDFDTEDKVAEGEIGAAPENTPDCGEEPTMEDFLTFSLPDGTYLVNAIESQVGSVEGGEFTPRDGARLEIIGGSCRLIELGQEPGFNNARVVNVLKANDYYLRFMN
ncbi:hypothetical protein V6R21_22115 [Limibacter armeniacum]|uniref:hypothetical protein n=1 Tax=Limibacter armeniacum TaxID=466084 RepID=UPI002FE6A159